VKAKKREVRIDRKKSREIYRRRERVNCGWNRKQDKDIDILKEGDTKRGQRERDR
jgi:hypothetical protein